METEEFADESSDRTGYDAGNDPEKTHEELLAEDNESF